MKKFEFCVLGFMVCLVLMDLVKTNYVINDHKEKREKEEELKRQAINLTRFRYGLPPITKGQSLKKALEEVKAKVKDPMEGKTINQIRAEHGLPPLQNINAEDKK